MELYNDIIKSCIELIETDKVMKYEAKPDDAEWKSEDTQKLIFQKEMAYELGGGMRPAIGALGFVTKERFTDEIWVVGEDLPNLKEDSSYGRITIINVDDSSWNDTQKAYNSMQRIDYTRYHVYPEGFMMRISTSAKREPVRISSNALRNGLNFQKVGNIFIKEYLKQPYVKGVKIIFITDKNFEYDKLEKYAGKIETVTASLNKILKDFVMDCNVCNLKNVCDEIEGLRQYHKEIVNDAKQGMK